MAMREDEFEVPYEEKTFIYPDARKILYLNMIENYKIFFPQGKLIYTALNYNSELKCEYLIIFTTMKEGREYILWDNPFLYTNRAIPAYRYAVKTNQHAAFFKSCIAHFCQIPASKFNDFITSDFCNYLSLDKTSPKYWKLPENSESLMQGFSEMGMLYIPPGFKNSTPPQAPTAK